MSTRPVRVYLRAWIGLMVLLALTCGSSFVPMGRANLVANFAIACAKAGIVLWLFMRVTRGATMIRVVALTGLAWLGLLVLLSTVDFAARL